MAVSECTKPDGSAVCRRCGSPFTPTKFRKIYCGQACNRADHRVRPRPCVVCGKPFTPKKPQYVCCGRKCGFVHFRAICAERKRAKPWSPKPEPPWRSGRCVVCGSDFRRLQPHQKVCPQQQCRRRWASDAEGERYRRNVSHRPRSCVECGACFQPKHGGRTRYCTKACANRHFRRGRPKSALARARRLGVPRDYGITNRKVFMRDGWRCQLCGRTTPRRLMGTLESNAPEVDHIVPFAAGGSHTWDNVQCACRACNIAKGGRPLGQLRML